MFLLYFVIGMHCFVRVTVSDLYGQDGLGPLPGWPAPDIAAPQGRSPFSMTDKLVWLKFECRSHRVQTQQPRGRSRRDLRSWTNIQTSTTTWSTSSPRWPTRTTPPAPSVAWSLKTTWRPTSTSSPQRSPFSSRQSAFQQLEILPLWSEPR